MQHATISAATTLAHALAFPPRMTATERRGFALETYQAASADPINSDWHTVADMLASVLPKTKAKASVETGAVTVESGPAWICYDVPNYRRIVWPSPVLIVQFSDGRILRVPAASIAGKPVNWGRAVRLAVSWYRSKIARFVGLQGQIAESDYAWIAVPSIESILAEDGGESFPATVANAETSELRQGGFDLYTVLLETHQRDMHWSATLLDGATDFLRQRFLEAREALRHPIVPMEPEPSRAAPEPSQADVSVIVSLSDARARRLMAGTSLSH